MKKLRNGFKGLQVSFGFTWLLAIVLCKLATMVNCQMQACSMWDIDLLQCFNRDINSSIDMGCCQALNQVVQIGYNCLCSLLSDFTALLSTPMALPLPNCSKSVPSLTVCGVLAPMPVVLPPDSPERNFPLPSVPSNDVLAPPVQDQIQLPLNLIKDNNHTQEKPHSVENPKPAGNETSNGKEKM
ncbi:hypothetical protein PTKIN_Ptkin10aG0054000 [Pterospermum kingtungense]